MSKSKQGSVAKPTTPEDASRVQSAVARKHNGQVPKDSYATRLQSAAARNNAKATRK